MQTKKQQQASLRECAIYGDDKTGVFVVDDQALRQRLDGLRDVMAMLSPNINSLPMEQLKEYMTPAQRERYEAGEWDDNERICVEHDAIMQSRHFWDAVKRDQHLRIRLDGCVNGLRMLLYVHDVTPFIDELNMVKQFVNHEGTAALHELIDSAIERSARQRIQFNIGDGI